MKTKIRITTLGLAVAAFMAVSPVQATNYTSDFPVTGNVYWNQTNRWSPNTGYPGMDISDTADVSNSYNNRMLYINLDNLHIAEFKYNAASTATLILRASDAARTATFDSLVKDSTSGNLMIINQHATNTLSLYVGNLEVNAGQIEFGGSDQLLEKFTVTGNSVAATNTLILNSTGKKVELGNLDLASSAVVRTSVRGREGVIEVSSLTGSGVVEVDNMAGGAVRGDLILNNTNASPVTFSGRLQNRSGGNTTGVLHVTKQGSGTQILTGANNTYSGDTSITAGTLLVANNSGSGTGTGAVLVGAAGTLGGTGIVAPGAGNNVTVSGVLSPGNNSEATLTFNFSGASKLDFASGSKILLTLGTASDAIAFTTAGNWLAGSGNVTLELTLGSGFNYGSTYNVFVNATTTGFAVTGVTGYDTVNYTHTFSQVGNDYTLSFQAVPEPGSIGLCVFGVFLLLVGAYRKGKRQS